MIIAPDRVGDTRVARGYLGEERTQEDQASRGALALGLLAALAGCGGRTGYSFLDGGGAGSDAFAVPCATVAECDDGLFCNGVERCLGEFCAPGSPPSCAPDENPCVTSMCDESARNCVLVDTDADEDGHLPTACGGDDCDDARAEVYPGADDICDYLDNDCDGTVDQGLAYEAVGDVLNLSSPQGNGRSPDIHFDGTDFDVVFDSWPVAPAQVFHNAVAADGSSESGPSQRTFSTVLSSTAELVYNGSEYGLFAHFHLLDVQSSGAIALTRLDSGGSSITGAIPITDDTPDADAPAAAWDGEAWGVAYVTNLPNGTHPIRFVRVSADGVGLGPDWLLSEGDTEMLAPSIAWDAGAHTFAVAHVSTGMVTMSWVGADGLGVDLEVAVAPAARVAPALVYGRALFALAWVAPGGYVRFLLSGLGGGTPRTLGGDDALGVDLAWTGREYAASYQDAPVGEIGTFLVRVGVSGEWASPPGRIDGVIPRADGATAVASNGTQYGVAYTAGAFDAGSIAFHLAGCR